MIDGAGGGETLPRHPANKARHLLLGEKTYGAAPVERCRNEIAMARDVRQHGIRRARLATAPRGEGIARCDHFARKRGAGTSSTQRKNVHGRVTSMHVSGQMGFPAGRAGAYAAGAGRSRSRTQPGLTQPELDAAEAGHSRGLRSRNWTQPKPDTAGAYAAEAGHSRGLRSRSRTQPGLTQAGGHAPNRVPRRVSCAGRGPGSGCAAAHARGPGAGCRRHSPGRGSAAGCAGRRLHRP